jgi:hypothetical protein
MQRLAVAVAVLLVLTLLGTAGYMAIEEWSLLDALFMTVITLSTVGYREVGPLSPAGKVYSMAPTTCWSAPRPARPRDRRGDGLGRRERLHHPRACASWR